jgi:large subunit ribosomal protein L22
MGTEGEARAVARRIRVSPQKLNVVAGLVRGMEVGEALIQLTYCRKRIAEQVKKTLQSAIANAENNHALDVDRLYIKSITVGKSVVMRRFRARARGRGARIIKPFSHLFVTVAERGEE